MPRPKGSKNKPKTVKAVVEEVDVNFDEKIAAVEAEIRQLSDSLKEKKAELKDLVKARAKAEKLVAERKAEEDKAKIMDALQASGKSIDEILEFLKK